jgi:hypothetical protein
LESTKVTCFFCCGSSELLPLPSPLVRVAFLLLPCEHVHLSLPLVAAGGAIELLAPFLFVVEVDGAEVGFEWPLVTAEVAAGGVGFVGLGLLCWVRLRINFFLFLAISLAIRLFVSSTSASSSVSPSPLI